MIDKKFWYGKKVFVTGHTGFKGSWLSMWLHLMGAEVTGFALNPPTTPSLFKLARIEELVTSIIGDIRDEVKLEKAMLKANPDIVIHMAAQPLVRESYKYPVETYATNVMGTVNLFESVRKCESVKVVINVTTDKVYENKEWIWGYREDEQMGGYDPYSNSKACSELVTSSYRNSFFNPVDYGNHGVAVASARAGNVIGGGDWAKDRLIPDCINSLLINEPIIIRNPNSIRPWQHVLEPLSGYLVLAQKLYKEDANYAEGWNFGPNDSDAKSVEWIVKQMCQKWGENASYKVDDRSHPHEAHYLKLDCSKAKMKLNWEPRWNLELTIDKILEWVRAYKVNENVYNFSLKQIEEYMNTKSFNDQSS